MRFTPGAVFQIDLPDGGHAYAVMLESFPHVAFYGMDADPRATGRPASSGRTTTTRPGA